MISFYIGPSGSGKTQKIVEDVAVDLKNGKKVYCLVPEQSAVIAEHRISLYCQQNHIPETELEILNFKRLSNSYYRRYGGFSDCTSSRAVRLLTMWRAFTEVSEHLKRYQNMTSRAEQFVPTLLSEIEEFKSYGVTVESLESARNQIKDNPALCDKLLDLELILSRYNYLASENGDTLDDMAKVSDGLRKNHFFDGVCVYLDGFSGFTAVEYDIIKSITEQAEKVVFSFCCEEKNARPNVFNNVTGSSSVMKKIEMLCGDNQNIKTETFVRKDAFNEEISFLEKNFYGEDVKPYNKDTESVEFRVLNNPYEEAEYVACDILRECRENGRRCGDFGVIVGNSEYASLVDSALKKHSLPTHVSEQKDFCETPIFRLIISALEVKYDRWRGEDVISFLKTGYTDVTPDECDALDDYVKLWRINGEKEWSTEWTMNPSGFEYRVNAEDCDDEREKKKAKEAAKRLASLNETRKKVVNRLSALCDAIDGKTDVEGICRELYFFIRDFHIEKDADGETIRLLNVLYDSLDAMVKTIGKLEPKNVSAFTEVFVLAVSGAGTGSIPRTTDSVEIGLFGCVYGKAEIIYVVGCSSDVLPPQVTEKGLFTDNDKVCLEGLDNDAVILSPCTDKLYIENNYDFYKSFCTADGKIIFTRPKFDVSGDEPAPSEQYAEALSLFDKIGYEKVKEGDKYVDKEIRISTEKCGVPSSFWIQDGISAEEYRGLLRNTVEGRALGEILGKREDVPLTASAESIDENIAKGYFDKASVLISPSAIEKYAACPFSYECSYTLGLSKKQISTSDTFLNSLTTGSLLHFVLEKYFLNNKEYIKKNGITDALLDRNKIIDEVKTQVDAYLENVFGSKNPLNEKAERDFRKLEIRIAVVIYHLLVDLKDSKFVPIFFEYKIEPTEVAEVEGKKVCVKGKIDRVDICPMDDQLLFRIIDYKSSGKEFKTDKIVYGINVQMLIYLVALSKKGIQGIEKEFPDKKDYPIKDAGVVYLPLNPSKNEEDAFDVKDKEKLKPTGKLSEEYKGLEVFEKSLEKLCGDVETLKTDLQTAISSVFGDILKGKANASPASERIDGMKDNCKNCDFRIVCRRNIKETEDEDN